MIGTGRWARELALEIAQTPGAELVLCWDHAPAALARFSSEFGVRAAAGMDEALADPAVEAGVACVPNAEHWPVAKALADAGKHVFVPRPVANTARAAVAMAAAAADAGVVLFVDHSSSFRPELDAMHELVEAGRLGKLVAGHAFRSADWAQATGRSNWHLSPRECPGGPATLLGVSAAATLIRFLGRPAAVRGSIASGLTESRVPDIATFLIEHETGAHSTLVTSSVSAVPNDHLYFYGTAGVLLYGPTATQAGPRALVAGLDESVVRELDVHGPRLGGVQMFVNRVRLGVEPPASATLALDAIATIEAGLRSVSENRRISVDEVLSL